MNKPPELLAPAGSFDAFCAALHGGADAIYLSGNKFNARAFARSFSDEELKEAFRLARLFGVKINVTLNILVTDRELAPALNYAEKLINLGADTFIVQDIGLARLLKKNYPGISLHASTQCACHNLDGVLALKEAGFSRVVIARELSRKNITYIAKNSPVETECFIHGAHCVSQSGGCLFSSILGGRSGNRGECAQPCRMEYSAEGKKGYPLSLKDMCLAEDMESLLKSGISSFKIEGRLKSPDYVYGVTSIYRRLIDEGRNATREEMSLLASLFSRDGFTNAYYTGNPGKTMLGVRTQADKEKTRELKTQISERRLPVDFNAVINREKTELTAVCRNISVTVSGNAPAAAVNSPLTEENVVSRLKKCGATHFEAKNVTLSLESGLFMTPKELNELRRNALTRLEDKLCEYSPLCKSKNEEFCINKNKSTKTVHIFHILFEENSDFDENLVKELEKDSNIGFIFLPLFDRRNIRGEKVGVYIPRVIFDDELSPAEDLLKKAENDGIRVAYCENIGAVNIAKKHGFKVFGGAFLNIHNSKSAEFFGDCRGLVLEPELSSAQKRDIVSPCPRGEFAYGRIPLMHLSRCLLQDAGCARKLPCRKRLTLRDRTGASFPVIPVFSHKNLLLNSLPSYRLDKREESLLEFSLLYFTLEKKEEVKKIINLAEAGEKPPFEARRK